MKMFQAVSETICIAEFGPELLPGWFATTREALDAFQVAPIDTVPPPVVDVAAVPRKPGRPRKLA